MKTINVEIKLFSLNELSEKAQRKAIEAHREFMLSTMQINDFISGDPEHDTEDKLREVFNHEYDYILYNDEPVTESIECNDYLFFENGELAHTTSFCGKHPKAGTTEFIFNGRIYILK